MNEILQSPNYLAYKFNFESENIEFLPIQQDELRQVSFLRREAFSGQRELLAIPLAEVAKQLDDSAASIRENPPGFIFHTAFCASTFLSRCLDVPGTTLGLREPQLLLDAANAKRLQWKSQTTRLDYRHLPGLALALLQKHADIGDRSQKLIIKPVNSVNNIIPELMQAMGAANALMLYTDAQSFLFSTLRKGEEARQTTRAMFDLLRCDFPHLANLRLSDAIHMSDLKLILTLWRLQIDQAESVLKHFSAQQRMASLHGDRLIDELPMVLKAANRQLDLCLSESQLNDICASERRFQDAKNPQQPFSPDARNRAYASLQEFYGEDIQNGLNWMTQNNPRVQLRPELSGALPL